MAEPDLTPLRALATGFVDPAAPDQLPPDLRGEGGVRLKMWLEEHGVTPDLVIQTSDAFRSHAERHTGLSLPELKSDLKTLVYERQFDEVPLFALFLGEALQRVDSPDQWHGLLRFLQRLATLMAFRELGSPAPPPPGPG